ncbi:hypothetical protein OHA21_05965 [Actinoplanes sp. NBC_00393]|uniref:hypothetical protein n=1 Tax=Actinoplanes sp. NBC_00393 TaxID=2975953 RepID=UPI002E23ABC3
MSRELRVTASVFGRTLWVVAAAIPFFYLAAATENEWMESLSADGVGSLYATAGTWAFFLLAFLPVMLWRFPRARLAATAGWALSLLPAAGLYAWGHSLLYCQACSVAG